MIFEFPIPETITTDPTRLKQILINLCSNAIKFTDKGSVNLSICYKPESNTMNFTIKDSGIGMSSEQLSELFKPFKQADSSTTRKFGGTGLGLYISKLLADKLGGSIKATSMIDVGSLFEVTVSAGEPGKKLIHSEDEILLISESKDIDVPELEGKILLAEDNQDNQELISLYIENTGANVEVVSNGRLAVERGITENFDLILMDMQMPEMDGVEAVAKLREQKCTTPIAILTANAMKEDKLISEKVGANYFLTKPINQEMFYEVLQKHLRKSNLQTNTLVLNKTKNEKMQSLFESYVARLLENCNILEALLKDNNWESLNEEIHKLKGTGGAFGFDEITELCTVIEEKIGNGDYKYAEELIHILISNNMMIYSEYNVE